MTYKVLYYLYYVRFIYYRSRYTRSKNHFIYKKYTSKLVDKKFIYKDRFKLYTDVAPEAFTFFWIPRVYRGGSNAYHVRKYIFVNWLGIEWRIIIN